MRGLALSTMVIVISVIPHGVWADAVPTPSLIEPAPLSQMNEPSDRLAGARVIDPDGKAIGAVQKVEWRDGRPERLDIALLGGEKTVTLEAFTIRYDASTNVLTASQSADQLLARPQT